MAKVAFTKLGLSKNQEINTFIWNEQVIEVKQYLPINDKLELISRAVNLSGDENTFLNSMKLNLYLTIEAIEAYTNINFTEKQKEDVCKLYDLMVSNGFIEEVMKYIPEAEFEELRANAFAIAREIYNYKNSAAGIIETITADYSNLNLEASEIQEKLADSNNMTLLKDVLTKLG